MRQSTIILKEQSVLEDTKHTNNDNMIKSAATVIVHAARESNQFCDVVPTFTYNAPSGRPTSAGFSY